MDFRDTVVHADGDGGIVIETKQDVSEIIEANKAELLGIPMSRVYATGSNKAKVAMVLKLKTTHYDNNSSEEIR